MGNQPSTINMHRFYYWMLLRVVIILISFALSGIPASAQNISQLNSDLLNSAAHGDSSETARLLVLGANFDCQDHVGSTPLMLAAAQGNKSVYPTFLKGEIVSPPQSGTYTDTVKILLRNGARVNQQQKDGKTALIWAASCNNTSLLQCLLENKANVNQVDIKGQSALYIATFRDNMAAMELLLKHGANPNIGGPMTVPVFNAAAGDNVSELELLAKYHTDLKRSVGGTTALMIAAQSDASHSVKYLLDANVPVEAADGMGVTALFLAAGSAGQDTIKLLLEHGADPLQASACVSPLDLAKMSNTKAVVQLMKRYVKSGRHVSSRVAL